MRRTWPNLAVIAGLLLSPVALQAPLAQTTGAVSTGRVIVKYKADAAVLRKQALSVQRGSEAATSLGQRTGLALSAGARLDDRTQVLRASGIDSRALAERLSAQADVEYAVPDERRHRMAAPNDPRYTSVSGNGPAVGQWYLRAPNSTVRAAINAEAAWDISTGSSSVVVAVLDTGIRFDHEDLKTVANGGNLLPGYDMVEDLVTANDGDGRDSDPSDPGDWVTQADLTAYTECDGNDVEPSSWHGTQTASLVGALTNNGLGMASVGRTVRVLPVRVLGKCGGFDSDIILGMRWAAGLSTPEIATANPVANHAQVINMSLGGDGACSAAYQDTITALGNAGVVVVASAGNSAGHAIATPANCNGVIAVAGLRHIGTKVGFSDIGPQVAIAAPGGNCVNTTGACLYPILTATNSGSTTPVAGVSSYSDSINSSVGTSFSAPLVAGTVGLMLSTRPTMSAAEVRAALQGSARSFPNTGAASTIPLCKAPTTADQDECYCTAATCGAGMLDASAAVAAASRGSQARITASSESPTAGSQLTLSGANSYVLAGRTVASYQWTLVDGGGIVTTLATSGGATATATPGTAGRFTVSLTLVDSAGQQSTTLRAVDVLAAGGGNAPGTPNVPRATQDSGGGGALGIVWLALLGAAVVALALPSRRTRRTRA